MTRGAVQTLTDTATFLVFHPVRSTLRVLGVAKVVVETVTGRGWASEEVPAPTQDPATPPVALVPPQRLPDLEPQPAAEQVLPAEPGESMQRTLEDWEDELDDGPEVPPASDEPTDEPLLDPSLTKQVKGDLDRGLRDAEQ